MGDNLALLNRRLISLFISFFRHRNPYVLLQLLSVEFRPINCILFTFRYFKCGHKLDRDSVMHILTDAKLLLMKQVWVFLLQSTALNRNCFIDLFAMFCTLRYLIEDML